MSTSLPAAMFRLAGVAMIWGVAATRFAAWSKHPEDAQWRPRGDDVDTLYIGSPEKGSAAPTEADHDPAH